MNLASNPISVNGEKYTYTPKGKKAFIVRLSEGNWIPVNVLVLSDSEPNAIKEVKDAIQWAIDKSEESNSHISLLRNLLRCCVAYCEPAESNQLYGVGWADNDTIT